MSNLSARDDFYRAYDQYIDSLSFKQFKRLPVLCEYKVKIAASRKVSKSKRVWALADAASLALGAWQAEIARQPLGKAEWDVSPKAQETSCLTPISGGASNLADVQEINRANLQRLRKDRAAHNERVKAKFKLVK